MEKIIEIPEGYEARIEGNKVVLEQKENEDEKIIKGLENFLWCIANGGMNDRGTMPSAEMCQKWLAYLEKLKEQQELPLMGEDTDLYFDEWKQRFKGNPTKRQCFEEGIRYSERKQKECCLAIPSGDTAPAEEDTISKNEQDFLENEISAFLCNYDKEFDDDAPTYNIAEHFYRLGKKAQEEQKPSPAEKPAEIVTPAFEDGKFIGARVCIGGEDFIIAPKDYKEGKEFNWQEAMDALKADGLATWNYRQICLTMAYRKEVDKILKDNGGDGLVNWYWTCAELSAGYSFFYGGYYGTLGNADKPDTCSVRPVLALAHS